MTPDAERDFLAVLGGLLTRAQRAGAVRSDVDARDVKALLVGCQANATPQRQRRADSTDARRGHGRFGPSVSGRRIVSYAAPVRVPLSMPSASALASPSTRSAISGPSPAPWSAHLGIIS
ncbi:MAG: hypothetical protein ACRDRO_07095 [Pseudonocardiaceae bacterium]